MCQAPATVNADTYTAPPQACGLPGLLSSGLGEGSHRREAQTGRALSRWRRALDFETGIQDTLLDSGS